MTTRWLNYFVLSAVFVPVIFKGAGVTACNRCPHECKDGDYLECYQCNSLTNPSCGHTAQVDEDYVILCPSDSFRCVFQLNVSNGQDIFFRDCRRSSSDAYWENTTSTFTRYCDTDRCNFSPSDGSTFRLSLVSVMAIALLIFWTVVLVLLPLQT